MHSHIKDQYGPYTSEINEAREEFEETSLAAQADVNRIIDTAWAMYHKVVWAASEKYYKTKQKALEAYNQDKIKRRKK